MMCLWGQEGLGEQVEGGKAGAQGRLVEADGSGHLCDQEIRDKKRRGIIGIQNSGDDLYKGGGWGGGGVTLGDGERFRKYLKQLGGDR